MREYFVPVIPGSKPTGNVGRGGNIYQNNAKYMSFKTESLKIFKTYEPYNCLDKCEGILIIGFLKPLKSRSQDSSQITGAILDILVTGKIIKDDRLTNFNKTLSYYFRDKEIQGYFVGIAETKSEWSKFLIDESEALQCRECFL